MIRYAFACSLLVISLGAGGALAHDAEPPSTQTNPASQINPTAKTYFDQGKAHEKKKSWDLAIAAYQQAVRLEPKFAEAWNNMGYCHRKLKQYDKALEAYKQAITLKPDLSYPHEYMSRTYLAMGNKDSAMREYEILKRLDAKMAEQLLKAIQANDPDLGDND